MDDRCKNCDREKINRPEDLSPERCPGTGSCKPVNWRERALAEKARADAAERRALEAEAGAAVMRAQLHDPTWNELHWCGYPGTGCQHARADEQWNDGDSETTRYRPADADCACPCHSDAAFVPEWQKVIDAHRPDSGRKVLAVLDAARAFQRSRKAFQAALLAGQLRVDRTLLDGIDLAGASVDQQNEKLMALEAALAALDGKGT